MSPVMTKKEMYSWASRIEWLRKQAELAYILDLESQTWAVNIPCLTPQFNTLSGALQNIPVESLGQRTGNLTYRAVPAMGEKIMTRMDDFLRDHHYGDFQFFDCGGRALVFRVRDRRSLETCVVRVEIDHSSRQIRPRHTTVLQPCLSNQAMIGDFADIKIEVMPEILPLTKLPARRVCEKREDFSRAFSAAIVGISWATNLTYHAEMFDFDAEPQNVGVLPSGRVVTLDPEIETGAAARERRHRFNAGYRRLKPQLIEQLYGILPLNP
jgi:hypothetical protein